MKLKSSIICSILALGIILCVAYFQSSPGYMDADYYYATGKEIANGSGLFEPFLWNYLDDPKGIPHPSHAYWSPLASFLAACGILITGWNNFSGGRVFFILLSVLIPTLSGMLANKFASRDNNVSLAMCLGLFSGFYLPYLGTTDTFGIYMLLGSVWLLIAYKFQTGTGSLLKAVLLGLIAGFMHLARADGIIWILLALLFMLIERPVGKQSHWRAISSRFLGVLTGYFIVMAPWMIRNLSVFGSLLSPAGLKVMWMTSYNDLYIYPASQLTLDRWLASGLTDILRSVLTAFWQNIQTALIVQGQIFMFPLIILGAWRNRTNLLIRWGLLAWGISFLMMTVVFPHAGWRGGFFHSGAATQILFLALVPSGLEAFVQWGVRVRGWNGHRAYRVFSYGIVVIVMAITTFTTTRRVIGDNFDSPTWNGSFHNYQKFEAALIGIGAEVDRSVMVNNPPGYFIASGRPTLSIPDGDISVLLKVANRYGVEYVIVEPNHPSGISSLFSQPGDRSQLEYLGMVSDGYVYHIIP